MSELTDRIAAEHSQETVNGRYGCACGESSPDRYFDIYEDLTHWHRAHIAAVTEAAVRERVARDIGRRRDEAGGQPTSATGIALRAYIDGAFNEAARIARGGAA